MQLSKNIGIGVGIGLLGLTIGIIILNKKAKNQVIDDVLTPQSETEELQKQTETTIPTTNRQGTTMTLPSLPPVTEIRPPKRTPITTKPPLTTIKQPTLIAGSSRDTYGGGGAGDKLLGMGYYDSIYAGEYNNWWDSENSGYRYQAK